MKRHFSIKPFKNAWRSDSTKHHQKIKFSPNESYSSTDDINCNRFETELNPSSGTYNIPDIIESTSESNFDSRRESLDFRRRDNDIFENEISLSDNCVGDIEEDNGSNINNIQNWCQESIDESDQELNLDNFSNSIEEVYFLLSSY